MSAVILVATVLAGLGAGIIVLKRSAERGSWLDELERKRGRDWDGKQSGTRP